MGTNTREVYKKRWALIDKKAISKGGHQYNRRLEANVSKDWQWALIGANKVIHSGKQAYFKALSLLGYNSGYSALYLYECRRRCESKEETERE